MIIKVGNFVYSTEKEFTSVKEAVEEFMTLFPSATRENVEKKVKLLIKADVDKSRRISRKSKESETSDTRIGEERAGEIESGKD